MRKNNTPILAISVLFVVASFALSYWPLAVLGVLIAIVSTHYILALALCLFLDVAYGVPTGFLHMVQYPFIVGGVVAVSLRVFSSQFLRKSSRDTL